MAVGFVRKKKVVTKIHCHLRCCLLSLLLMHGAHCSPDQESNPPPPRHNGDLHGQSDDGYMRGISLVQSSTRKEAELFLDQLFAKYGKEGVITFEGFEHLLQSLGIGNVTIVDHDLKDHFSESGFIEFHEDHEHVLTKEANEHHHGSDHDGHHHDNEDDDHHGNHHSNEGRTGSASHGENRNRERHLDRQGRNSGRGSNHGDSRQSNLRNNRDHDHDNLGDGHSNHGDRHRHPDRDTTNIRPHSGSHRSHKHGNHGSSHHDHGHRDNRHRDSQEDDNDFKSKDVEVYGHSHEVHHTCGHNHDVHSTAETPAVDNHEKGGANDLDESEDVSEWFDFFGFPEDDYPTTTKGPNIDDEESSGDDASEYYYDFFGNPVSDDAADVSDPDDTAPEIKRNPWPTYDYQSDEGSDDVETTSRSTPKKSKSHNPRRGDRRNNNRDNHLSTTAPSSGSHPHAGIEKGLGATGSTNSRSQGRSKRAALSGSTEYLEERKCLTAQEILTAYHIMIKKGITVEDFVNLCPAIIYQIDAHACTDDVVPVQCTGLQGYALRECITKYGHDHGTPAGASLFEIKPKVWGYAVLAVTIISLVGLFSVAIVPVMRKVFYNYLIQFLVAVAIGSLTGDALLHLIPHSIDKSHSGGDHNHGTEGHSHDGVYKGLIVLFGIYFFFVMERFMDYWTERRQRRRKMKSLKSDKFYIRANISDSIGEKLSHHEMQKRSVENIVMARMPGEDIPKLLEDSEFHDGTKDEIAFEGHSKDLEGHKGHGHSHGHSHGDGTVPDSIAAIAWMVIMGDGLHNFSDGLAIGAAFANSITGGLSTSVAVFCHELPHELGDFAVLLRAGMSVKQALFYNIVSSILCFVGMVIGVVIGNINEASLWIFSLTAGIFIYISMVDMLPEITNPPVGPQESRWIYFLAQFLGITAGVAVMLVIALFEEKIRLNLDDSQF